MWVKANTSSEHIKNNVQPFKYEDEVLTDLP